jgi:hypothetical protein
MSGYGQSLTFVPAPGKPRTAAEEAAAKEAAIRRLAGVGPAPVFAPGNGRQPSAANLNMVGQRMAAAAAGQGIAGLVPQFVAQQQAAAPAAAAGPGIAGLVPQFVAQQQAAAAAAPQYINVLGRSVPVGVLPGLRKARGGGIRRKKSHRKTSKKSSSKGGRRKTGKRRH